MYLVDGGWSSWTYGPCSKTCGGGTQRETRSCDNPTPYCGGNGCSGLSVDQNVCNDHCCPSKFITLCECMYVCVCVCNVCIIIYVFGYCYFSLKLISFVVPT